MEQLIYDDHTFDNQNFAGQTVKGREFQSCVFKNCDFTEANFGDDKLLDCTFQDCNLSMLKLKGSTLNNVEFLRCKILAVTFYECQDFLFSVYFNECTLDYSSFMRKKMLKTTFIKSSLKEVNFTQANLSGSVFHDSDLLGAVFNETDLSSANFESAYNYSIDPELNNIRKASFTLTGIPGLLDKYQIRIK